MTGGLPLTMLEVVGGVQQSMATSFISASHGRAYVNQSTTDKNYNRSVDFWSVDIDSPSAPTFAGQLNPRVPADDPDNAVQTEVLTLMSASSNDQVLYACSTDLYGTSMNGLVAVNVSSMTNITVQPVFDQCPFAFLSPTLALIGLADPHTPGLRSSYQILDLSGPTPVLRGIIASNSEWVVTAHGHLVVFWYPFAVADISDIDAPVVLATSAQNDPSVDSPGQPGIVVSADQKWAYVSTNLAEQMWVVDLRNLSAVTFAALANPLVDSPRDSHAGEYSMSAAISPDGQRLALSNATGLGLYDLTDPSTPVLIGAALAGNTTFSDDGTLLYVSGPSGLQILSVPSL